MVPIDTAPFLLVQNIQMGALPYIFYILNILKTDFFLQSLSALVQAVILNELQQLRCLCPQVQNGLYNKGTSYLVCNVLNLDSF